MGKIIYFTAGPTATPAEVVAMAAISASINTLVVRNGAVNNSYGAGPEATDLVAGTIPTEYAAKPVFTPPATGGDGGRFTQWRLKANTSGGVVYVGLTELQFRLIAGTAESHGATGKGGPTEGGHFSNYVPAQAFDNDAGTRWGAPENGMAAGTAWIGYLFPAPRRPLQVAVTGAPNPAESPYTFTIEGTNNGTDWTVVFTQSVALTWTASEVKLFAIPAAA